jgi:alpha-mannosidase
MRITLMRAPTCPDRTGDHGINTFKYAFHPHAEDWRNDTVQMAHTFNVPPVAVYNTEATNGNIPAETSLVSLSEKNVMIDAIKKAQDGRGYIVRVVEQEQKRGTVSLSWCFGFEKVIECNMIEEDIAQIASDDTGFEFAIKPFEVKTFRII